MRYLLLLGLLCACAYAQVTRPDITRRGDTLFAPEAQSYQWLRDGGDPTGVPGATQRFYLPPADGNYTVTVRSLISEPLPFELGRTLAVAGAVLDEFLRPIAGAEVTVGGRVTHSDAAGRFFVTAQRTERLAARAQIVGYHAHTVGFMPTAADTQFVMIHLAKNITTHKLPAKEGGTISQGGFWLTLPPKSVVTADGKAYSGEIQLSVVARRPGDRDFAQRMPGGDFMAEDKTGESKVLYSYGFTGVEMQTTDGKPLNMAPNSVATIEFLITEDQRPGAPDEMPLWHFDETAGLWKESGTVRKAGLTYRAEVPHFSWWNYDRPYPPAYIEGKVVDCKGAPVMGGVIIVDQRQTATDNEGRFKGTVPATIDLDFHVVNTDTTLAPLEAEERRLVGTFDAGWGAFQAVGWADTNKLLTIYAYGQTEGVEYSLDGENWQPEPTFVLETDTTPAQGWARVEGCDTTPINVMLPQYFKNCRVYDDVGNLPRYTSMSALLRATKPVYCVKIQGAEVAPLLQAARLQPCVQELSFSQTTTPPAVLTEGMSELFALWPNLQWLYLEYNDLTAVPESLGNLTNLQTLDLYNNQLAAVPEALSNLSNLQYLDLAYNQLPALPESLGNLSNLETLVLNENKLTSLPTSFANLADTLKILWLQGNPISTPQKNRIIAMLPNTTIIF